MEAITARINENIILCSLHTEKEIGFLFDRIFRFVTRKNCVSHIGVITNWSAYVCIDFNCTLYSGDTIALSSGFAMVPSDWKTNCQFVVKRFILIWDLIDHRCTL